MIHMQTQFSQAIMSIQAQSENISSKKIESAPCFYKCIRKISLPKLENETTYRTTIHNYTKSNDKLRKRLSSNTPQGMGDDL